MSGSSLSTYHDLANVDSLNDIGDHGDIRLIMTKHTIILSVHGHVLA